MSCFEGQLASWVPAHPMTVSSTQTIAALVAEYSTALYRVAFSVTRNAAEAEDAVQETFLRVLRHESRLGEIRFHIRTRGHLQCGGLHVPGCSAL